MNARTVFVASLLDIMANSSASLKQTTCKIPRMATPCRKNLRLKGWDYSSNACYHVTICTHGQKYLFGTVTRTESLEKPCIVALSKLGKLCDAALCDVGKGNPLVSVENYIVMPNHIHVLVWIRRDENHPLSLGTFVRFLKSRVTKSAHAAGIDAHIWQKGFYERIVRNDQDFFAVWEYIDNNPAKWDEDPYRH